MEAMTFMRDAAVRPSPTATQLNSTTLNYQIEEQLAFYNEWLGIKMTECGAWSTASQAFQRDYCATHGGRTARQHHDYMATMYANFFEAALAASADFFEAALAASAAPATPAAEAAAAAPAAITASAASAATASSARCGGELISHGASPATITATPAVPPAASPSRITAACAFMPQQHHDCSAPAALLVGPIQGGAPHHRSDLVAPAALLVGHSQGGAPHHRSDLVAGDRLTGG
jgi:hypothetical protein